MARIPAAGGKWRLSIVIGVVLATIVLLILAVETFPISFMKSRVERAIAGRLGSEVAIGSLERREFFSLSPTLVAHKLVVRQPRWAGAGEMLRADTVEARIHVIPLLLGSGPRIDHLKAHGLAVNLIRDMHGRANWSGNKIGRGEGEEGSGLSDVSITDARMTLRDDKRALRLAGQLDSNEWGLRLVADGHFHDAPASLTVKGAPIAGVAPNKRYPFSVSLISPLLDLHASGVSYGALNLRSMTLDVDAKAPNLKYLDDVIEAGLFGTGPIRLKAKVRHQARDWFIERMTGSVGRSNLVAKADILKREGRTKINGDVHMSVFDFDDLSDAEGRASAARVEARIGKRVLPGTRINIAKVGPTDGTIRFRADKLLLSNSAFKSLSGVIRLDGKLLRIDDVVAGMSSGEMTGTVEIDQRSGRPSPRLSLDLTLKGGQLETLIGTPDVTGPLQGRAVLSGSGDTIRDALAHANGRAGLFVRGGTIKKTFAAVLGQDLGKAIGSVLGGNDQTVPLRCLAAGFSGSNGELVSSPFVVATGISVGQGKGHLSLANERVALTLRGQSRNPSALELADPIQIGGTFSSPTLSAAGSPPGSKMKAGSVLKAVGKSLGRAIGVRDGEPPSSSAGLPSIDCARLEQAVL